MRRLAIVAALLCSPAFAQEEPTYLKGEELKTEADKSCTEGCILLNAERVAQLEAAFNTILAQRVQAAFEAGKRASDETCRNKI